MPTDLVIEKVKTLFTVEKLNSYEISNIVGVSSTTVQRILNKENLYTKENRYSNRRGKYVLNLDAFKNGEFSDYWAGFIAADGCIYKNRLIINISNKDYTHLKKFNIGYPVTFDNTRDSCRVDIPSKILCDLLEEKYFITSRKTCTLDLPILENYNHYLRGYFDGDGGVYIAKYNQRVVYLVGTETMLLKIQEILPLHSKIITLKNTEKVKELRIWRKDDVKKFFEFIYKDASILLERKHTKFNYF